MTPLPLDAAGSPGLSAPASTRPRSAAGKPLPGPAPGPPGRGTPSSPQLSERPAAGGPDPGAGEADPAAGNRMPASPGRGRTWNLAGSAPSVSSVLSAGQMAIAKAMSEDDLEEQVLELCKGFGILRFHNPDSRRVKERGLPDDILIGPRGVLWRELKNMKRKLTPEQEQVGADLLANDQDWAVWRPVDLLSRRIELELRTISGLRVAGGAA